MQVGGEQLGPVQPPIVEPQDQQATERMENEGGVVPIDTEMVGSKPAEKPTEKKKQLGWEYDG